MRAFYVRPRIALQEATDYLLEILSLKADIGAIKRTRPKIARLLRKHGGKAGASSSEARSSAVTGRPLVLAVGQLLDAAVDVPQLLFQQLVFGILTQRDLDQ